MFQREYSAVFSLALVMAVRMLGLFIILPVFSMHAADFTHATAQWIGVALGIYGLTQALLQIPLALWSDRIGRKPVMAIGLGVFILGSVCAAATHSIYGLIIGRALQGAGAIGSTVLALAADLTREENRSKAMGMMGLAIGVSFAVAMMLGPVLNAWVGLTGIFWIMAGLALLAELLVWLLIPAMPPPAQANAGEMKAGLMQVLTDRNLLCLDASIFFLHAILTAVFIAIPIILGRIVLLSAAQQTELYLLVLLLAFALMLPVMILAEKYRHIKPVFLMAIGVLLLTQGLLWRFHQDIWVIGLILLLFFTAFSLLEAILPSWISKIAPLPHKGAAMGCYSTAQFLGIFAGGSAGGWVFAHFGLAGISSLAGLLALIWLGWAQRLSVPPYLSTVMLNLSQFSETNLEILRQQLYGIAGIAEVAIMPADALVYLKIDRTVINKLELHQSLEKGKLIDANSPHGGSSNFTQRGESNGKRC